MKSGRIDGASRLTKVDTHGDPLTVEDSGGGSSAAGTKGILGPKQTHSAPDSLPSRPGPQPSWAQNRPKMSPLGLRTTVARGDLDRATAGYDAARTWGSSYRDVGGFGSAVVVQDRSATPPIVVDRRALSPDGRTPTVDLHVTSQKELKWGPARDFIVKSMQAAFPDFSADNVRVHTYKVRLPRGRAAHRPRRGA